MMNPFFRSGDDLGSVIYMMCKRHLFSSEDTVANLNRVLSSLTVVTAAFLSGVELAGGADVRREILAVLVKQLEEKTQQFATQTVENIVGDMGGE